VVNLGKRLRNEGWQVRILGEGAAGGYITHPAAWRDPLNTLMSLVKFFAIREEAGRPGPFHIWCELTGQDYKEDFTFSDILSSLPAFTTTPTSAPEAMLKVVTADHGLLKARYQKIFLRDWEEKKASLRERGITGWEACSYNGENSTENIKEFAGSGRGGFKIIFTNEEDSKIASLWMRGSGTEPVFRIIADLEGTDRTFAESMIQWQRRMVLEADGQGSGINAKR
jgi:phosphoglucomutase